MFNPPQPPQTPPPQTPPPQTPPFLTPSPQTPPPGGYHTPPHGGYYSDSDEDDSREERFRLFVRAIVQLAYNDMTTHSTLGPFGGTVSPTPTQASTTATSPPRSVTSRSVTSPPRSVNSLSDVDMASVYSTVS